MPCPEKIHHDARMQAANERDAQADHWMEHEAMISAIERLGLTPGNQALIREQVIDLRAEEIQKAFGDWETYAETMSALEANYCKREGV